MANSILTPTAVTREALRILHQKLNFVGNVNRQYDDSFAKSGARIGDTLKIRLPNKYTVRTGATLSAQDTTENSTSLQIATQKGVDLNFTSVDLTLNLDDFSKRVIEPAMAVLAANIEADALNMYRDVFWQVGTAGTPATFAKLLQARKRLNDSLAPPGERIALINTQDNVDLVDALKGLFQDGPTIAKQYREGMMGRTAGLDFYENTLIPSHPRGAASGAYTANVSAVANNTASVVVATGTGNFVQGDIITIAGVFEVHPETRVSTGRLQQFTVTSAFAGGAGTLTIAPAMYISGPLQNVSIPSGSATAAVTVAGTASTNHGISMLFAPEAFTFATADLLMPEGVDWSAREVYDGISMRIVRQYDINNDKFPCRLDVLYGYKTIRPELATRLAAN